MRHTSSRKSDNVRFPVIQFVPTYDWQMAINTLLIIRVKGTCNGWGERKRFKENNNLTL